MDGMSSKPLLKNNVKANYHSILNYAILFTIGCLLCFARAPYTILKPVMYTEDGVWLGRILTTGLWDTLLNAKQSYLVVGNILLLYLSLMLNSIFFGKNIIYLPIFISIVSYAYYSLLALTPVIAFRKIMNRVTRILLFFTILCFPCGASIGEIYGRISNIGYGTFVISGVLFARVVWDKTILKTYKQVFIYLVLFLCCITNPTCYILIFGVFSIDIYTQIKTRSKAYKQYLCLAFFALITVASIGFICFALPGEIGQSTESINLNGLVEFFARSWLYPFIWTVYETMNDFKTIVITGLLIVFLLLCVLNTKHRQARIFVITNVMLLVLFSISTLVARKTLTSQLNLYTTSFPDRYFYVQNIFIIILAFILASFAMKKILNAEALRIFAYSLVVIIGFSIFLEYNSIFEIKSKLVVCDEEFAESVACAYEEQNGSLTDGIYIVPIQFDGFSMAVPEKHMNASIDYIQKHKLFENFTASNMCDVNWKNGISADKTKVLITFSNLRLHKLKNSSVIIANGKRFAIVELSYDDNWIVITIDGDASTLQYPNTITAE